MCLRSEKPCAGGGGLLPRDDRPSYVVNASSFVAVLDLPRARIDTVLEGLILIVDAGRMHTVSLAWKLIKDPRVTDALNECKEQLVVKEAELVPEVAGILDQCGHVILGHDPTGNPPEPFLLALAVRQAAHVVSEQNVLIPLPEACGVLGLEMEPLATLIDREDL